MEIRAKTNLEAWEKTLKYVLENGTDFKDHEKRICREIINLVVTIEEPSTGITKPIEELNKLKKWTYPDLEELRNIMISKQGSMTYEYTYGERVFNFNKKDQIHQFIKPLFEEDEKSRRGYISFWNPEKDSNVENKNIPSLVGIYFKKEEKLNMTVIIRSNDIFIGWPANMYQLYFLHKYVADLLGFQIGSLTTFSNSAHAFEEHFTEIERILKRIENNKKQ